VYISGFWGIFLCFGVNFCILMERSCQWSFRPLVLFSCDSISISIVATIVLTNSLKSFMARVCFPIYLAYYQGGGVQSIAVFVLFVKMSSYEGGGVAFKTVMNKMDKTVAYV